MNLGWENRSQTNFNPMGGAESRAYSITSPIGGAIGRTGNDWN